MLQFAPDATDVAPEVLSLVSGIPTMRGYRSPPAGSSSIASALSEAPKGGAVVLTIDGAQHVFAGTGSYLYRLSSGTWNNVSRTGNYTVLGNPAAGYRWRFASFGNHVYAATGPKALFSGVSTAVQLQSINIKTGASTFGNVDAPAATCIAAVGNFLFLGNLTDATMSTSPGFGTQGNRWWCSGLFDAQSIWTPSVTTQCTSGLLVDTPGEISAIAELDGAAIVYKNSSIYRGEYVGPPEAWRFRVVAEEVGTYSQECVVNTGDRHFFIGGRDIYEFNGVRPVAIGAPVREWFFARVTKEGLSKIQAMHDPNTQTIFWFYPADPSSTLDSCLVYHYGSQRFGHFSMAISEVLENVGGSAVTADGSTSVSQLNRMYLDGSYATKSLTAAGTAFTCTTNWTGDDTNVTLCRRVRPKFRTVPSDGTLTPSGCMYVGGTVTTGSAATISSNRFDFLQAARYHRFALSLTGDTEIEVINPEIVPQGLE